MRRGFTLLETMVVVALTGVLAATVIPAVGLLDGMRSAAATAEVARLLRLSAAHAAALGQPVGLRIDTEADTLLPVIAGPGGLAPLPEASGDAAAPLDVAATYPGCGLDWCSTGSPGIVWFASSGTPVTLDAAGRIASAAPEAEIRMVDGARILIRAGTGLVEVQR